jgi:asparagine synthase (glutamine-hydrolysing)
MYPRLRRLAMASSIPGFTQGAKLISQLGSTRRGAKIRSLGSALTSRASTFQLIRGLFTPHEIQQLVHPDVWENGRGASAIMWPVENLLKNGELDPWREVAVAEQCIYMRNQLLRDADWASMKHGLEVRVPLVDRQLSEALAVRLARTRSEGKALLAQSLRKALPDSVLHRRKTGFALPMQQWVSEEIEAGRIRSPSQRFLHPAAAAFIEQLHNEVTTGTIHWSRAWALHCLARWIDTQS